MKLTTIKGWFQRRSFERSSADPAARALTASEVLLLEALQICKQEAWLEFERYLRESRIRDQRRALVRALQIERRVYQSEDLRKLILESLRKVRDLYRGQIVALRTESARADGIGTAERVLNAEQLLRILRQSIAALPDPIQEDIDQTLCDRHRWRMVGGLTPRRPKLPKEGVHPYATYGLALSGGGIRSASFCIGVLQALAKFNVLPIFKYVSSVSGGGYAASWLLTWAYRHQDGLDGVAEDLDSNREIESAPMRWIRRYSSYLAPRLSLTMTSDAPALVVAYFFNWLPIFVLICLALSTALLFPHLLVIALRIIGTAAEQTQRMLVGVCACVLVLFIGFLRRLTLFHRVPTNVRRYPAGLALFFLGYCLVATLVAAVEAPVAQLTLRSELLRGLKVPYWNATLSTFGELLLFWLVAYAIAIGIALLLATRTAQLWIDKFRRDVLGLPILPGGPLKRLEVPAATHVCGIVASATLAAVLTQFMLGLAAPVNNARFVVVLGPAAAMTTIAAPELVYAFLTKRFVRDVDRAWSARLGGWMFTPPFFWMFLAALALTLDDFVDALVFLGPPWQVAIGVGAFLLIALAVAQKLYLVVQALGVVAFVGLLAEFVVRRAVMAAGSENSAAVFIVFAAVLSATILLGLLTNVNRFSLHSLYREGLVRTFLGASRLGPRNTRVASPGAVNEGEGPQFETRRPDPMTNIDDNDDPALWWLQSRHGRRLPVFLLNAAVNGRSPTDFEGRSPRQWPYTFSQYFSGSPATGIGYSRTRDVFSRGGVKGLTLGTAMAVSGAAVSPTGGRATNVVRAFLYGLLNARLGLWIGNPSMPNTVSHESPSLTGLAVLAEALGIRTRFFRWIHLSDGGHFENLGIYELVRRGCTRIIAIDGSCDPEGHMSDLANAIRRARIDLGIEIRNLSDADANDGKDAAGAATTDALDLSPPPGSYRWFAIDYGHDLPPGRLLYIKPRVSDSGEIAIDVRHYWKKYPSFPHETTADQFFTESQMEAYRSLGHACGKEALRAAVAVAGADPSRLPFDKGLTDGILRSARAKLRRRA